MCHVRIGFKAKEIHVNTELRKAGVGDNRH
jgi:hypothetical protein